MTSLPKATVATQMHHGVIACEPDASLRTVARAMESHGIHCVLVTGLANAAGGERFVWAVVTDVDLVAAAASDGHEKRAADVAQTEAAPPSSPPQRRTRTRLTPWPSTASRIWSSSSPSPSSPSVWCRPRTSCARWRSSAPERPGQSRLRDA